jgi:ABC-2 type transport system permease protein
MTFLIVPRHLLLSEWIKLRSLRSSYLIVGLALGLGFGIGLLDLISITHSWTTLGPADREAFDPVADSFSGFQFAELAFGAFGVLAITSEYATGTIAPTLTAAPHRGSLYIAKALVLTVVAFVVCEFAAFAAFGLGQAVLSRQELSVAINDPEVLRAVTCAGLYMSVITMVGFGLGAIIRHTAGALTVMVGLVFLAWPVARAAEGFSYLPDRWLLVNAADALVTIHPVTGPNAARTPSPAMACTELATYLIVLLGAGAWRAGRDA